MSGVENVSYTISGHKVYFPGKPYPSQLSMMSRVVQGLDKGENCLLESPTGSGKSLALLCSALAWQANEHDKAKQEGSENKGGCCGADDGTVFTDIEEVVAGLHAGEGEDCCSGGKKDGIDTEKRVRKVPKIYFGTRTHKQIAQITRELGKTHYRGCNMTILASREHTCIDPVVSSMPNKNEECKNKLEIQGCHYHDRVKRVVSQASVKKHSLYSSWELDDFKTFCKQNRACPYFGSRELASSADIVFCPYNYLIDPKIRSSMEINLKGQIVILDEAHNIEDAAREAASYAIKESQLTEAIHDIQLLLDKNVKPAEHNVLLSLLNGVLEMVERHKDRLGSSENNHDFDTPSVVWHGLEMVALLQQAGIDDSKMQEYASAFSTLMEEEGEGYGKKREPQPPKISSSTRALFEGLLLTAKFILADSMKHMKDYRMALVRSMVYVDQQHTQTDGVWLGRRRGPRHKLEMTYTLHFWCLNPAVAFEDMGGVTKSVIVTSGTLSPLASFQSELGTPFPIQLEASHVITSSQLWVGAISHGPSGGSLLGSYQNSETLSYQDNLGELILRVCKIIPHGVLCFLPSYKSLEKLSERWKLTGLWSKLEEYKEVFSEPRSSKKDEFETTISSFYEAVKRSSTDEDSGGGGLFLAVCRGKVSEGLDFADNNARAVIAVGIPYPNYRDTQVELKQKYNNDNANKGLLSGRDWYEIQAFRALNQALGRCIRHRKDWGALILVDDRYAKNPNKYTKGLSKWIRQKIKYYTSFNIAQSALEKFMIERRENPVEDQSFMSSQQSPGNITRSDSACDIKAGDVTMTADTKTSPHPMLTSPPLGPLTNQPRPPPQAPVLTGSHVPPQPQIVVEQHINVKGTNTGVAASLKRLAASVQKVTLVRTEETDVNGAVKTGQYLLVPNKTQTAPTMSSSEQSRCNSKESQQAVQPSSINTSPLQNVNAKNPVPLQNSQAGGFLASSVLLSPQGNCVQSVQNGVTLCDNTVAACGQNVQQSIPSRDVLKVGPDFQEDLSFVASQMEFKPSFTSTQAAHITESPLVKGEAPAVSPVLFDSENDLIQSVKVKQDVGVSGTPAAESLVRKPLFRKSLNQNISTPMKIITPIKKVSRINERTEKSKHDPQMTHAAQHKVKAGLDNNSANLKDNNHTAVKSGVNDIDLAAVKTGQVIKDPKPNISDTKLGLPDPKSKPNENEVSNDASDDRNVPCQRPVKPEEGSKLLDTLSENREGDDDDPFAADCSRLKTRRLSRSKRKRNPDKTSSKESSMNKKQKSKGVEFDNDIVPDSAPRMKCYSCSNCGSHLAKTSDAITETTHPWFMQSLLKNHGGGASSGVIVLSSCDLGDRVTVLSVEADCGVSLNSVLRNGECIQYMQCVSCSASSGCKTCIIGALVKSVSANSKVKPSQVWLLPQCISVS